MKWNDYRKNGVAYVTRSAIAELKIWYDDDKYKPTFTLSDEDHDGLYSFPKLFLKYYTDPTEMQFVNEVFEGDLDHWEKFKKSSGFEPIYEKLRKKADIMLQSAAISKIVSIAFDENNKNNLPALKYLVEKKPVKAEKGAGRPKKEPKEDEIDSKDLLKDIERLKQ